MSKVAHPEWVVTCARCGREIPGERSRLFWMDGTYRICGALLQRGCNKRRKEIGL